MITFNAIYTKIRSAVIAIKPHALVSSVFTPMPSNFPAVFVREVGRFTPNKYVSFANSQNVQETTIEVQIYSNKRGGSKAEADSLLSAVESAMSAQYFVLISAAPIDNPDDTSIYRIAARFRRIVGGADAINN